MLANLSIRLEDHTFKHSKTQVGMEDNLIASQSHSDACESLNDSLSNEDTEPFGDEN